LSWQATSKITKSVISKSTPLKEVSKTSRINDGALPFRSEIEFQPVTPILSLESLLAIRSNGLPSYLQADQDNQYTLKTAEGLTYRTEAWIETLQAFSIGEGIIPNFDGMWLSPADTGKAVIFFGAPAQPWITDTYAPKRLYPNLEGHEPFIDLYTQGISVFWAGLTAENHYEQAKTYYESIATRDDVTQIVVYGIGEGAEHSMRLCLDTGLSLNPNGGVGDRGRYLYTAIEQTANGAAFGENTLADVSPTEQDAASALLDANLTNVPLWLVRDNDSSISPNPPYPSGTVPENDLDWHAEALASAHLQSELITRPLSQEVYFSQLVSWISQKLP